MERHIETSQIFLFWAHCIQRTISCERTSIKTIITLCGEDRLNFLKMSEEDIFETIRYCYDEGRNKIQVILTNGKTICGTIPGKTLVFRNNKAETPPFQDECFSQKSLIFRCHKLFNECSIFIPIDRISGINILSYKQEVAIREGERNFNNSVNESAMDHIFNSLFERSKEMNFGITHHHVQYSLNLTQPFEWIDISFGSETPLYSDWAYLGKISGGINSIGFGLPLGSFSAGWNKSLWSSFKKKTKSNRTPICDVKNKKEVLIRGHVNFLQRYENLQPRNKVCDSIEMEGSTWIPASVSEKKPDSFDDLQSMNWVLVYFKNDEFMFPSNQWEKIVNKIDIYCDVVSAQIETEIGRLFCFLKARCAISAIDR